LPSAHEGHPIALLEAAVYEVPLLATAIPANLALPLPRDRFFPVGDVAMLSRLLLAVAAAAPRRPADAHAIHTAVRERYSWRNAAERTSTVYRYVARGRLLHG